MFCPFMKINFLNFALTDFLQILPLLIETPIKDTFHHSDIFNDSGIHCFPKEMLTNVPHEVWEDNDEPRYDANDPEIVAQSVLR